MEKNKILNKFKSKFGFQILNIFFAFFSVFRPTSEGEIDFFSAIILTVSSTNAGSFLIPLNGDKIWTICFC